jgi:serine protease inhibitor ecotin
MPVTQKKKKKVSEQIKGNEGIWKFNTKRKVVLSCPSQTQKQMRWRGEKKDRERVGGR